MPVVVKGLYFEGKKSEQKAADALDRLVHGAGRQRDLATAHNADDPVAKVFALAEHEGHQDQDNGGERQGTQERLEDLLTRPNALC